MSKKQPESVYVRHRDTGGVRKVSQENFRKERKALEAEGYARVNEDGSAIDGPDSDDEDANDATPIEGAQNRTSQMYSWHPSGRRAEGDPARTFTLSPPGGTPLVITEGEEIDFDRTVGTDPNGRPVTIASTLETMEGDLKAQFKPVAPVAPSAPRGAKAAEQKIRRAKR